MHHYHLWRRNLIFYETRSAEAQRRPNGLEKGVLFLGSPKLPRTANSADAPSSLPLTPEYRLTLR